MHRSPKPNQATNKQKVTELPTRQGMVLVDAYWIPQANAANYINKREHLAQRLQVAMAQFCNKVERCWAGSEDGEAVVGYNSAGEIQTLRHLDPDTLEEVGQLSDAELLQRLIDEI